MGLVYGGGRVGLMGILADAVLAGGGDVIGVIPRSLHAREVGHEGLSDLRVVATMHERKALMADLSDAFLALPGGFGTWDELCEAVTWSQIGIHAKPCAVLDVLGYYGPLLAQADRAVADGFVRGPHRAILLSDTDPARLLDRLAATVLPPTLPKWIGPSER
jgi:uncharacterized protein (TIGR00730 family)